MTNPAAVYPRMFTLICMSSECQQQNIEGHSFFALMSQEDVSEQDFYTTWALTNTRLKTDPDFRRHVSLKANFH